MMVCFVTDGGATKRVWPRVDLGRPGRSGCQQRKLPRRRDGHGQVRRGQGRGWRFTSVSQRVSVRALLSISRVNPNGAIRLTARVFCFTLAGITRWRWRPRLGTSRVRILRPPICQLNASPHRARSVSSVRTTGGPTTWRVHSSGRRRSVRLFLFPYAKFD